MRFRSLAFPQPNASNNHVSWILQTKNHSTNTVFLAMDQPKALRGRGHGLQRLRAHCADGNEPATATNPFRELFHYVS